MPGTTRRRIRYTSAIGLAGLAALVLTACGSEAAVDSRLVGSWHTLLGQWMLVFEPQADGTYRTRFTGPFAPPIENGEITARDGRWQTRKANGEETSGSYRFVTEDMVVFEGERGTLVWQRGMPATTLPGGPPTGLPSAPPAAPATALRGDWPLRDLRSTAREAGRHARQWQADAILTGITAELLAPNSPVVHNVDTAAGRVTLTLRFCSPSQQRALILRPTADGQQPFAENPAECLPEQAIPDDFPDLPDAVRQARDRGMQAPHPREARLVNRINTVPGEDEPGIAWQIFSPDRRDRTLLIRAGSPGKATVRVVDACRLITRADAEAVLGGPVEDVPPHYRVAQTYSCQYGLAGRRDQSLGLMVDESPARNVRQFMDNLRRNRRTAIDDLGDEAYLFDSPAGMASLDIRVGDTLLQFTLSGPHTGRDTTLVRLARQALDRLAGGDAVIADAAPDRKLVGQWTAAHGDWRLLLTVRVDRALTLSAARVEHLVLGSDGEHWHLVDRARRDVHAGTYRWQGDGFTTGGAIEGAWRRVLAGQDDHAVPAPLLLDSGIGGERPALGASPWPRLALDDRLPGLWQGQGRTNRVDATLLWRIRADAPSTLVTVVTGRGEVHNVDRWRRVILKFSDELQRIGRQLDIGFHDGAIVTGFDDDNTLQMQWHNLDRLQWTRVD